MDAPVFLSARAAIGMFRCPVSYASFRNTGPIERCIVVFPRTTVWIQHEGSRRFLSDPGIVTIYNRAQRYERFAASPEGDRCDWFGLSDDIAREIAAASTPAAGDAERPFGFEWAPSSGALYMRQRALFQRASAGAVDVLEVEEAVMGIVAAVLSSAVGSAPASVAREHRARRRHQELAEAARVHVARELSRNVSIHDIACSLGTSPYHLCRVFRSCTGRSLHDYRNELRIRRALELFTGSRLSGLTISSVAHELGFSSHSHFVRAVRRHLGTTPGAARAEVLAPRAQSALREVCEH